jgi:hypothetical protein
MAQWRVTTKAHLIEDINRSWLALNDALDNLSEDQLTNIHDAEGWSAKDHITHMAAWERSVVYFLQGKPRHEGLGVGEELYLNDSEDDINAAVREQKKDLSLAEARAELNGVHRQLLDLLAPMTDIDLRKSHHEYLPDEPGDDDGRPAFDVIYGNSASHFTQHLAWIKTLVATRKNGGGTEDEGRSLP